MIRNIIFDLGNVLISFRPAEYLERNNYPDEKRNTILKDIFMSPEWLLLDNGTIDTKEAIDRIDNKSILKRAEIVSVFNKRTGIMFPLDDNVKMLPALRKEGFKIYFLSNFPLDSFNEIKNSYSFFKYFDGGIISAEVKHSKPDPAIYLILMEKYSLKAGECILVDDTEVNVMSAEDLGIKGFFTAGSTCISKDLMKFLSSETDFAHLGASI